MASTTTRTFHNRKRPLWWDFSRFVGELGTVVRAFPWHHTYTLCSERRREEINVRRLVARAEQSREVLGALLAWPRPRGESLFQLVEDGYLQVGMKWRRLRWIHTARERGAAAGTTAASPSIPPFIASSRGEP